MKKKMKKKEKILIFILISILGFIANVYLSEMLDTLLLGNDINIKDLKFFNSLKNLFINEDKKKLFLLLECIKYLGIAFFITQNNKPYQAELVKITDNIYTPKQVGQYQYSSSRWKSLKRRNSKYGLGLKSIKNIVNKYNGNMKINIENNTFKIKIILILDKL